MNRILVALIGSLFAIIAFVATPLTAQERSPHAHLDDLPPLIDRELFFGDPEYASATISPDGQYIAFRSPHEGVMNIWVKDIDAPFDDARLVTADSRPVPGFFWSQDSQYILYVQDRDGDENFHVHAVNPQGEADDDTGIPEARNLTPYDDVQARIFSVPRERPGEIMVGLNDRDPSLHDLYRVDIDTGERELLYENTEGIVGYTFDLDGELRLATRQTPDGGTEILRYDDGELSPVYSCGFEESCSPARFQRDGERVYMSTNAGEDVDLTRLVLFNPETGEETLVEEDPKGEVDFGGAIFSNVTNELLATVYVGDLQRIYPHDEEFADMLEHLHEQLPEGEISIGSRTRDEMKMTVSVTRDVDPGSVYVFDRETGEVELLYRSRPELPVEHLAEMTPIRYTARDGLEIPAYLTIPQGVEPENLPLIVVPHGGPWARDYWGYNPEVQFFANRGYAVLQPNFRGSTGFGKEFLNAGNMEWGTGYMQHDITDGVQYLIDEGIAHPDYAGIYGGSYGGYATLAGLAFTPELYAAGISFVGPSNIITLIESIPPYWRPIREQLVRRVGDPDDPEQRERLEEQSPLFSADNIRAPLMVIQGANDPRVVQHESDQIVVALRDRGYDVEYLLAEDEGHGFRDRLNRLAMRAAMDRFFAEHLGGRYQEEMTDETAERLEQLLVDPDTVELPEPTAEQETTEARTAPLPQPNPAQLTTGTFRYTSTINVQGQELVMETVRKVEQGTSSGEQVWRIVSKTNSPFGASTDTVEVHHESLKPVRFNFTAGQATGNLSYEEDRITGTIRGGGQQLDIDESLEAPVFGHGAALEFALAALPLEPGFEVPIRYYDPQMQALRVQQLQVISAGSAEVPAGSFDTWTVVLESRDDHPGGNATIEVTQESPHFVVWSEAEMPAQTGTVTSVTELVEMDVAED